jgi:hypothetical protein
MCTWLVVPATAMPLPAVTPMLLFCSMALLIPALGIDKVSALPKETVPPPVSPLPELMVIEL